MVQEVACCIMKKEVGGLCPWQKQGQWGWSGRWVGWWIISGLETKCPALQKTCRSCGSITTLSREGRLCSAPIHPQTCQFHSNVSSKFCHLTCATVAPMSPMRAGWPPAVSWTIMEPRHDCTLWRWLSNWFKLQFLSEKQRMSVEVLAVGGDGDETRQLCGTRFHFAC